MKKGKWLIGLLIILILSVIFLTCLFIDRKLTKIELLESDSKEILYDLNITVKSGYDYVEMLKNIGDEYFNQVEKAKTSYYDMIKQKNDEKTYAMDNIKLPYTEDMVGNLTGIGDLNEINNELRNEIEMALTLNPFFSLVKKSMPNVTWIYYTSANMFINLYPWVPSSDFSFMPKYLKKEFFYLGLPENNPKREILWTNPYIDEAGKGLMVTVFAPVYDEDTFKGTVALDLTLETLSDIIKMRIAPNTIIYIKNQNNKIIGYSNYIKDSGNIILEPQDILPERLKDKTDELNMLPADKISRLNGYYVLKYKIDRTQWEMFKYIPVPTLYWDVFTDLIPVMVIVLLLLLTYIQIIRIKIIENEMKEKEIKYRTVFNQSTKLMSILTLEGRVSEINKSTLEFTGSSIKDTEGKYFWELSIWGDNPEFKKMIKPAVEKCAKGRYLVTEVGLIDNEGKKKEYELSLTPVRDEKDKIEFILAYGQDMTERKKFEEDIIKARNDAESANRAKGIFLANMSHEIRTPMNSILGFTQIMQKDTVVTKTQKEYLDIINRSGEHLLTLINEILEMSKIESGKIGIKKDNFDIYALIEEIYMMFSFRSRAKNLELIVQKSENVPQFLYADANKIRQILINLIGNALKFTDKGGITVSFDYKEEKNIKKLYMTVQDTGIGIPEKELDKVFQKFEQTESGRKSMNGTGLGLAITQNYIKLMKGNIDVKSKLNEGTTFKLYVPVDLGKAIKTSIDKTLGKIVKIKEGQPQYKVMVVEDDKDSRIFLVRFLQSIGFSVKEAVNGKEAVELLKEWNADIVLMDMMMPVMDGYEAIKLIRKYSKYDKTVIFSITASCLEETKEKVLGIGADEFISKPYKVDDLLCLMKKHLKIEFEIEDICDEKITETGYKQQDIDLKALDKIPGTYITQMFDALNNGYIDKLNSIINDIKKIDLKLAERMQKLSDNYDYEELMRLIDRRKGSGLR